MELLCTIWYLIICISVVMYILLDGFDLGVGSLIFLGKNDGERRVMLNSIGPLWDGNEVWLIIIGGALFAGFPLAYATLCSAYYTLIMILLFGIILRAVSIEFRSKVQNPSWRRTWDAIFCLASLIMTFGAGLLLGSMIQGIPFELIENDLVFTGTFADFFSPFTLSVACTGLFLFALHGANFLLLKTENNLQNRIQKAVLPLIIGYLIFYGITTHLMRLYADHMFLRFQEYPFLYLLPLLLLFAVYRNYQHSKKGEGGLAFIYSCLNLATLFLLAGFGYFPTLLRSSSSPKDTIVPWNAASDETTLMVILTIAAIGLPFVFAYGIWVYRTFKGKVELHDSSY